MAAKFLGQFLLERGTLTPAQLLAALDAQRASNPLLGELAIHHGIIPPTINLQQPGEGCDLDYVPNEARQAKVDVVMSNGFGFGGTNGTLVFRRI